MATLVGFVLGRNVVVRQTVVPDYDSQLSDYAVRDDEKVIRLSATTYDLMTSDTMAQLTQWLVTLDSISYQALTDADVTEKVTALLNPA